VQAPRSSAGVARAAALEALLVDPGVHLVTLSGPGGVGKTRLASEVARTLGGAFPAGCPFVDLSVVGSTQAVLPAILTALGASDRLEHILAKLGLRSRTQVAAWAVRAALEGPPPA
jgi:predicted ATPase